MSYTAITRFEFKTLLAQLLQDPGMVYWVNAELDLLIDEALRTFGLLCAYWKQRDSFNTSPATSFYDLSSKCSTTLGQTIKDQDLVSLIEYHLLEPAVPGGWIGTEMFILTDLTQAIQKRRNQFLLETGCFLVNSTVIGISPPVSRIALDDHVIDVRRLAWKDVAGVYHHLWVEDEEEENAFLPGWNLRPDMPESYSVGSSPPLQVQLIPPPMDAGLLDMVSVTAGADLDPVAGVLLGIPDDLAWVVKWGAMADLLKKDGPSADPLRAEYCEQRWTFGLELAKLMPSVLQAYINDQAVPVEALANLDAFYSSWQNETGVPQFVGMSGRNLIAVAPLADAGPYSVTLDLVRNAPLPVGDGGFIQVGREELDVLLGYAKHLAMWKKGAFEIKASLSGWQNLVKMAALKNDRLAAATKLMKIMLGHAGEEERVNPRVEKREEEEATGTNG